MSMRENCIELRFISKNLMKIKKQKMTKKNTNKKKKRSHLKKAPYGALYLVKMELLHILQYQHILQRQ